MRPSQRAPDEMRTIRITRNTNIYAEGSALIECGNTKVICSASIENTTPRWIAKEGHGWVTAEYGMLPRSTSTRMGREAVRGKQGGRTIEIQRLIGRALRAAVDLHKLGEHTIKIDCDVIQADGGTRTASISGAWVALHDAIMHLLNSKAISSNPLLAPVAAISVGVYNGTPVLDLDYSEDSSAQCDINIVMNGDGDFIEVQGTAEAAPFSENEMNQMLALARKGIGQILDIQQVTIR